MARTEDIAGTAVNVTGSAQAAIVRRPRLDAFVDALVAPDSTTRLALICAGPGFGKTTMVRSWTETCEHPVAYVSFEGLRPTPRLFWRLVLRALASADASTAEAVARLAAPDRAVRPDFVVELADALATQRLLLVLDDVHALTDRDTLSELDHLLRRLPASVRTLVLSRSEPPLSAFHDLRISGDLHQVRSSSLAFTAGEVSEVCAELSPRQQRLVMEHTEGWPAMVRLMLVALQDGLEVTDVWDREMALLDHLFAEVFSRRPPALQEILLMSSVADPVPLALVVELTGRSDAGTSLDETARRSGLLTRLTERGEVTYHLHPILAAFLRAEFLRQDLPRERSAHLTASRWYLSRGDGLRATQQALLTGDPDAVERSVAESGLALVNDGQAEALVDVLTSGPPRPRGSWELVVTAAALLDLGRTAEATAVVESMAVSELPDELAPVHAAAMRHLGRREGRAPVGRPRAIATIDQSADAKLYCALHDGTDWLRLGLVDDAEHELTQAVQLAEGLGRRGALVEGLGILADVSSVRSDFRELDRRSRHAVEVADRSGWSRSQRAALAHLLAGWAARQDLDDTRARHHASTVIDLVDPTDDPTIAFAAQALNAAIEFQGGEGAPADAHRLHDMWRDAAGTFVSRDLIAYAAVVDAHFSLALGRADRLHRTSEAVRERLGTSAESLFVEALHQLGLDRRRVARLRLGEAQAAPAVVPLTHVEVLTLSARLWLEDGDDYAAREALEGALDLADRLGGLRPLSDAGTLVLAFLRDHHGGWGRHEDLVGRLLAHATSPRGLDVPLTQRELAVLRQLPTMRTVDEIATTMVVSVNTVKTHLRNVYRKLGVASRRDAVTEARRWGLL